jgi:hypothetical protein
VDGALENLRLADEIYPGWTCRIYLAEDLIEVAREVEELGGEVVLRPKNSGQSGLFWRYEAMLDNDFDALIFRDTDCRLSRREKHLVDLWLASDKNFHAIRDHPEHIYPLMGGLFGLKKTPKEVKQVMKDQIDKIRNNAIIAYNDDQEFLSSQLYPLIQNDILEHDSSIDPTHFITTECFEEFIGKHVPG